MYCAVGYSSVGESLPGSSSTFNPSSAWKKQISALYSKDPTSAISGCSSFKCVCVVHTHVHVFMYVEFGVGAGCLPQSLFSLLMEAGCLTRPRLPWEPLPLLLRLRAVPHACLVFLVLLCSGAGCSKLIITLTGLLYPWNILPPHSWCLLPHHILSGWV